jgi:hypothetical protein
METEFVKSLHNNYERIHMNSNPDENRYQYCILSRGGIHGLLECSMRYINGDAYLYYDITSRQNLAQMFHKHKIDRTWMKDFVGSLRSIRQELDRFLLNDSNILWFPEHIFQDLEENIFSFLYVPYLEEENGFESLLDFIVDNMDYDDDVLVDFVYKMYEQYEENGEIYLQGRIYEDVKILEARQHKASDETVINNIFMNDAQDDEYTEHDICQNVVADVGIYEEKHTSKGKVGKNREKRGLFAIFDGKKNKGTDSRDKYRRPLQLEMDDRIVAEESLYDSGYGKTMYIPEQREEGAVTRRLYSDDGKMLMLLGEESITIGKISEEADVVLDDLSVSRIHARILKDGEDYFLEDLNATNGTFKNGLRLKPYEKRKLLEEDEITLGKVTIVFR